jgi:hypothetical protein
VSESPGQWLKGCAFGCGGLAALVVLLIVAMSLSMRSAFRDAHVDRVILEDRFGGQDAFTPAIDGTVAEDRVAAFLTVRQALAEVHAEVEDVDREMGDFDSLADEGEPKLRVALPAVFRLTKSMMGLPWIFGEIERVRNRALVEAGMGLGEYTYIFVVAYHDFLVAPSSEVNLFSGSPANRRVRADLQGMIRRQLAAATSERGEEDELVAALAAEVDALQADDRRLPWQDGLPQAVADCFARDRDRLDATYSAASAEFDLLNSSIEGGGFRIEMN